MRRRHDTPGVHGARARLECAGAVVELGVELSGREHHDHRQVHPRQQNDYAADGSVGLVVRREVRDVEAEEQRDEQPEHRADNRSDENLFRMLLDVRQIPVDEIEREHDQRDRDGILHDRPRQHEVPIEVQLGTDCLRYFGTGEHDDARDTDEQSHHEHGCELDERALPPRPRLGDVVRRIERVDQRTEHRAAGPRREDGAHRHEPGRVLGEHDVLDHTLHERDRFIRYH